jgi:hypothetical protein
VERPSVGQWLLLRNVDWSIAIIDLNEGVDLRIPFRFGPGLRFKVADRQSLPGIHDVIVSLGTRVFLEPCCKMTTAPAV